MWNPFRRKPVVPYDPVFDALANRHICPDCKHDSFLMGPKGGMGQNVKCEDCGSEFNLAPFEDGQWCGEPFIAERIGEPMPKYAGKGCQHESIMGSEFCLKCGEPL
jgi:hypothetical protein